MSEDNKISPGMEQYLEIKKEYPEYLLFYRLGDFYELFFDDAVKASEALNITLTKRGKIKNKDVPMCGVPFHAYEAYLAKLIKCGYKVAICEQMENPAEARKRGSKSVVRRDVVRLVTAGTLTEDTLLDGKRNNYLLCVCRHNFEYGFSWLDLSTGDFYIDSLKVSADNEASEVQNFLVKLQPAEIIISDSLLQNPELFAVLNEYREKLTVLPQARFNFMNTQKKILEFFETATTDSLGMFVKAEIISCGLILDYVENTQKGKIPRIKHPQKVQNSLFMEIDGATRYNLGLVDGGKYNTLFSVMDRTITGAGARMLARRLTSPLIDLEQINYRLDIVEFFCRHDNVRHKIRELLAGCPDMERSLSRLSAGRGGPRDLVAILQVLMALPKFKQTFDMYARTDMVDDLPVAFEDIKRRLKNYPTLIDTLSRAIDTDVELPLLARDGGFIRKGFSAELDALRDLRDEGQSYIKKLEDKYIVQTEIEHLKIKYNNVVGYFVEVPAKEAKQLLNNPEFIHRQSVLNAARFTTVELTELENNIRSASERFLAMEMVVYENLVRDVMVESGDISDTATGLAELDIGAGLAELALENNYCRPKLDNSLIFNIEDGRHPVVENAMRHDGDGVFIGNNCNLDKENRIWLLTGPNMAGKSTFLRQNALIAIMAQSGSFVPAKSAHIGVVDKVFSRVGASDDLSRGRSTFMVEMVETASILNRATERSFVILDEIGRGTATFDGLSIAWAVVEYLHEVKQCRSLFATHYHELTVLADKLSCLTLHCMKIKEFKDQVIFLHEVIGGASDRSYGIHVAKLAGLPKTVTKRAEEVLKKLEKDNQKQYNLNEIDLPLFAYADDEKETNAKAYSLIEEELRQTDPDNMTAREALDKLYELKEMLKGN